MQRTIIFQYYHVALAPLPWSYWKIIVRCIADKFRVKKAAHLLGFSRLLPAKLIRLGEQDMYRLSG